MFFELKRVSKIQKHLEDLTDAIEHPQLKLKLSLNLQNAWW